MLDYPVRGIMPRLIDDYLLLSEFDNKTVILDMTAWPPKRVLERDVYCLWARQAGDGRWSLLARQDERDFGLLLLRSSRHRGEWYFLKQGSHKIDLKWSAFLGTELLVAGDKKQPPYFFRDGDFVPVANLPASVHAHPGLVRLESGKMFFLWNKALYEYQRKGFVQIPNLKISDSFLTWTSVPRENDSFFYLSGRKLFEYRSRTKPVRHGPWKNLIHVRAGPKRSILVEDAVSPQGDIAKLYFPKEESVLLIPPHAFGLPEAGVSDFVCWAPRGDRIVCGQHGKLRAVPAEHVLGFDRKPV